MYMESLAEKRKDSKGNYGNWDSTIKHLKKYCPRDIQFSQLNKKFVEGFKEYLMKVKMNWNGGELYKTLPVTLDFSKRLSRYAKQTETLQAVPYDFRFFM